MGNFVPGQAHDIAFKKSSTSKQSSHLLLKDDSHQNGQQLLFIRSGEEFSFLRELF